MFEHLSILTAATPVPTVLDVSIGHNRMTSNLSVALASKPRRRGITLNQSFRISPPASIVDDLSVRVHKDPNCGTCDSDYNPQLNSKESGLDFVKGDYPEISSVRVFVVEDYEPFRRFVCSTLEKRAGLQVIYEASDGLDAVRKVEELQPDLILLDVGLATLNGIEAARRIRELAPESKILFVSQESSADVVQEALGTGANGYVVKTDAGRELLEAVNAVLRGEQFIGRRFSGHDFVGVSNVRPSQMVRINGTFAPLQQNTQIAHRHDVGFYSDDARLLDDLTQFIVAALKAGNAAIVVATELHRERLLPRLQARGLDIGTAFEQGRYIPLDAADTLSALMLNGMPDPVRFLNLLGDLIVRASKAATAQQARVAIFGECVHLLWAQGNAEAAIQFEKLGNQLANIHDVDILCGYSPGCGEVGMEDHIFQQICAEHSAVYSR
jgi:DNA-binding NarL/FixJ family response regulator